MVIPKEGREGWEAAAPEEVMGRCCRRIGLEIRAIVTGHIGRFQLGFI